MCVCSRSRSLSNLMLGVVARQDVNLPSVCTVQGEGRKHFFSGRWILHRDVLHVIGIGTSIPSPLSSYKMVKTYQRVARVHFRCVKLGRGWIQPGLATLAAVITECLSSPRRVSDLSATAGELSRRRSVIKCRVVFALNQHRMKQELNVTARRFTVQGDEDSVYTVPWRCA